MSFAHKGVFARRLASAAVDWSIEFGGGILGSYFGAMMAALFIALKNEPAESMQVSMWNGLGFGFVFWGISVSFINRVMIQGLSRSSIGKKVFKLELISSGEPLTWTTILKRWVLSYVSFASAGMGYFYALIEEDGKTFHDLFSHTDVVSSFKSRTMTFEYRDEEVVPPVLATQEMGKIIVLSHAGSERPSATIIHLPVRTEPVPMYQSNPTEGAPGAGVTLADVIELAPAAEKANQKKAA